MKDSQNIPPEIAEFCRLGSEKIGKSDNPAEVIEFIRKELAGLAKSKKLFGEIISNVVQGKRYPDLWQATMFNNELLLYADPNRLYSLRLFLWEPGKYTEVHDHGSWGVIGPVLGKLEVIDYDRLDDGSKEGRAKLTEKGRMLLVPGEMTSTLPENDGIHKVGNPTEDTIVSLSLYGTPLARGYVIGFNIEEQTTFRIYSPTINKKLLAMAALPSFETEVGRDALKKASKHPLEIIRDAAEASSEEIS